VWWCVTGERGVRIGACYAAAALKRGFRVQALQYFTGASPSQQPLDYLSGETVRVGGFLGSGLTLTPNPSRPRTAARISSMEWP
jgi:hypothetical protein